MVLEGFGSCGCFNFGCRFLVLAFVALLLGLFASLFVLRFVFFGCFVWFMCFVICDLHGWLIGLFVYVTLDGLIGFACGCLFLFWTLYFVAC